MLRHYLSQDFLDNMGFRIHTSQSEVQTLMLMSEPLGFDPELMEHRGM
jgi:hypothetical protein